MGGRVELQSAPELGTTCVLTLRLPLTEQPDDFCVPAVDEVETYSPDDDEGHEEETESVIQAVEQGVQDDGNLDSSLGQASVLGCVWRPLDSIAEGDSATSPLPRGRDIYITPESVNIVNRMLVCHLYMCTTPPSSKYYTTLFNVPYHPLQITTPPSSKYHTALFKVPHHSLQSTTPLSSK